MNRKRARASSVESRSGSASLSRSDTEASDFGSDNASNSGGSRSSSSSGERDFGEDSDKQRLGVLLQSALALMRPGETCGEALQRLSRDGKDEAFAQLTGTHTLLLNQYSIVLVNMTRKAILTRALNEATKDGTKLDAVWMLRWSSAPTSVHGPFRDAEIREWATKGYFTRKEGELQNINSLHLQWEKASLAAASLSSP